MSESEKELRILFVDDDVEVLGGLSRLLFDKPGWEPEFAGSGEDALEALAQEPFDVLVTDLKMPGMSGVELLQQVHQDYPDVVRVVLTAHAKMEATLKALSVSHSFLTKPCQAEDLERVIRRAMDQRALLHDERVRSLVGSVDRLPVKPAVYTRLTRELVKSDPDISQLSYIVSSDVGLSAKVLHLTNSAFFGSRRKFVNIPHAVSFVGSSMLKQLVLSVEAFQGLTGKRRLKGLSLEAEQAHGLACGGVAKQIAQGTRLEEAAFLAGMLHDVGKIVWAMRSPKTMRALVRGKDTSLEAELSLAGTTHSRVGAYLLGLWGLDEEVVEAVAYHHQPAEIGDSAFGLAGIVHVANQLAHDAAQDGSAEPSAGHLDHEYLERVGVAGELERWSAMARQLGEAEKQ